jgi:hypothetical protein
MTQKRQVHSKIRSMMLILLLNNREFRFLIQVLTYQLNFFLGPITPLSVGDHRPVGRDRIRSRPKNLKTGRDPKKNTGRDP